MIEVTRAEKIAELIREIALRETYYVKAMTNVPSRRDNLQRRIEVMKAILADYQMQQEQPANARPPRRDKAKSRG